MAGAGLRGRFSRARLLNLALVGVVFLLLGCAVYVSLLIKGRQDALRQVSGYNVTWLVSQGALEVARFHGTVASAMLPGTGVDDDNVSAKLDIVGNRLTMFEDGETAAFLKSEPELAEVSVKLKAFVAEASALMDGPPSSERLPRILAGAAGLNVGMAHLASAANVHGGALVAADQKSLDSLHWSFAGLVSMIAIIAIGMAVSVMRSNRSLTQANRRALEHNNALNAQISAREEAEAAAREKSALYAEASKENARLEGEAYTDALTGISNRRKFDEAFLRLHGEASERGAALSIVLLDVDHFKKFNDRYGHQIGDECLRRVAKALARFGRRSGEVAARYGGEEFALILPGLCDAEAMEVAEAVRAAVSEVEVPDGLGGMIRVTASLGVCSRVPSRDEDRVQSIQDMTRLSDEALYASKEGGRNRVSSSTALPAPSAVPEALVA